jgi:pimeloyl-ACP methyl ester carboxylesterase
MSDLDIYLISGLGADQRLFGKLNLQDHRFHPVEWIEPDTDESLPAYCKRLAQQIKATGNVILIGVSFGGIVAIELARLINAKKIIIISSIKATSEKPWYFVLLPYLFLHRIVSPRLLQYLLKLLRPMFGRMTNDDYQLFKLMIKDANPKFLRWGIESVLKWQSPSIDSEIVHIHGDRDLIFPIKKIRAAKIIKGGNHYMVVQRAEEISKIVNQELA